MSSPPTLSIIVPVHNGGSLLIEQLDALASCAEPPVPTEVLVVDNRSADGTAARVERWSRDRCEPHLDVRVVQANDRQGEPHARNVGLRASEGELIAYCDADDIVDGMWMSAMAHALMRSAYVTGPVLTDRLNAPWQVHMRGRSGLATPATTYGGIPFANGCNMGFRRDALLALGGFDESFLIACDIEIAIRAWRAGMELTWDPDVRIHYRLRPSIAAAFRQASAYGRSRARIKALVPDVRDRRAERSASLRRLGWLARHLTDVRHRGGRARWAWVAGQVEGELHSSLRGGSRSRTTSHITKRT